MRHFMLQPAFSDLLIKWDDCSWQFSSFVQHERCGHFENHCSTIPVQPKVFIDIKLLDSSRYIKGLSHLHTCTCTQYFQTHVSLFTQSHSHICQNPKLLGFFLILFTHAKTQIKSYALSVR